MKQSRRKQPVVAICGRPNVGKSTLFNQLTGRHRAIVHAEEGITRDRAYGVAEWEGRSFRVVDTGGIVENPIDPVVRKMQEQVRLALDEASAIIFVVDGQEAITRVDEDLRLELLKYGKPIVLAVNKLDNPSLEQNLADFYAWGIGDVLPISSGHAIGIGALAAAVTAHLPAGTPPPEESAEEKPDTTRVAVVGKPNVGKSSFINAILNEERTIVDDRPGTTRDAIDIEFHWNDKDYLFIDTAGMRKKAGITRKVEEFSVVRALRSVRRADLCLIMIDAVEGISEQDKRIVNYAVEIGTAMVMVWTKWDLVEDKKARLKEIDEQIDLKAPFLKYVPTLTISSKTRKRLFTVFEYIDRVAAAAQKRIGTGELNRFIEGLRAKPSPAMFKGKQGKILYVTQASIKPTTFVLFVNQKRLFHFSYTRFIENQLRAQFGFDGVPIRLELREGRSQECNS